MACHNGEDCPRLWVEASLWLDFSLPAPRQPVRWQAGLQLSFGLSKRKLNKINLCEV